MDKDLENPSPKSAPKGASSESSARAASDVGEDGDGIMLMVSSCSSPDLDDTEPIESPEPPTIETARVIPALQKPQELQQRARSILKTSPTPSTRESSLVAVTRESSPVERVVSFYSDPPPTTNDGGLRKRGSSLSDSSGSAQSLSTQVLHGSTASAGEWQTGRCLASSMCSGPTARQGLLSERFATFGLDSCNKAIEGLEGLEGMSLEEFQALTHEEHNGLISRTAGQHLDQLVDDEELPEGVPLAEQLDLNRCLSTRWGQGLTSVWSTITPMARTKSKFQRGASLLDRPAGGWFSHSPQPTEPQKAEVVAEWGSDVPWWEFPHFSSKIGWSTLCLFLIALAAHLVSNTFYCIATQAGVDTMDRCYLNYREKITGGVVEWVSPSHATFFKGNDQVPITPLSLYTLFSYPEEPRWSLNMDFDASGPELFGSDSQKALVSYGPEKFLNMNASMGGECTYNTSCDTGGWVLYLMEGKLSLWTNQQRYESETLAFNAVGSTRIQAFIAADQVKSTINFRVTNNSAGGCYTSTSSCDNTVTGNLNFDGFSRRDPNFWMNIGGRGWTDEDLLEKDSNGDPSTQANGNYIGNSQLWRSQPQSFLGGDVYEATQLMNVSSEYGCMYFLMFCGTLIYLSLWVFGNYTINSKGAELGAEIKRGEKEVEWFVDKQEKRPPRASMDKDKPGPPRPEWGKEINLWKNCQKDYEQVVAQSQFSKDCRLVWLRIFAFLVLSFWMWACMMFMAPTAEHGGLYPTYATFHEGFIRAWNFDSAPAGWLFLGSSVIETLLFVIATTLIAWPAAKNLQLGICPHKQKLSECQLCQDFAEGDRRVTDLKIQTNDTCLLIACHNSAINDEMRTDFLRTLHSAVENFPPEAIFICDNGRGMHPSDNTKGLIDEFCDKKYGRAAKRRMNYVYVPEGNKTHALYWVTEWWIPFLVQKDKVIDFKYLVMIDDDVPLPHNFDFEQERMEQDPSIMCFGYGISAVTPTDPDTGKSEFSALVSMQDLEYKISGFFKYFQYKFGGCAFYAHGAVSIWRRDILGKEILYKHDTEFNGEDMYMGLLTHRLSEKSENKVRIAFEMTNLVDTYAPDNFNLLFKQRVKSWDLGTHRKFKTVMKELCCRWKNQHFMLKIFHCGEVVTLFLDWIRLYMLALLFPTNPLVVCGITVFFMAMAYILLALFRTIVLRNRKDLRDALPLQVYLLFPFYKIMCTFLMRQFALMENAVYYSMNFKRHTIEKRLTWPQKPCYRKKAVEVLGEKRSNEMMENTASNFPPRPDTTNPDWWHVWEGVKEGVDTSGFRALGARACAPKCVIDHVSQFCNNSVGDDAQIVSMRQEDQGGLEHMMMALIMLMQLGVESNYTCFRSEVIAATSNDWASNIYSREIFDEIVQMMELAPYDDTVFNPVDSLRDGADADEKGGVGAKRAILQHDTFFIDWYRAQVNDAVAKWLDAAERTVEEDLRNSHQEYGRHLLMTPEIATCLRYELVINHEDEGRVDWEEEMIERIIYVFSKIIEELAKMRLVDQFDPFKPVKLRLRKIVRDLQMSLESRKEWRRFATLEGHVPRPKEQL